MKTLLKNLTFPMLLFVFTALNFIQFAEAKSKPKHHSTSHSHHQGGKATTKKHHHDVSYHPKKIHHGGHFTQRGVASWYGPGFHGHKTASGERFNMYAMTAAHRTLGLSSIVKVTNLKNHKTVVVRVTDRGPFARRRVIDLSKGAAMAIGMNGTSPVLIESM